MPLDALFLLGAVFIFALALLAGGVILAMSMLLVWGTASWLVVLAGRWRRAAALIVAALVLATVILHWTATRQRYAIREQSIADRIAASPRFRQVPRAPTTLVIRGRLDGLRWLQHDCMDRVFVQRFPFRPLVSQQGSAPSGGALPRRYLELVVDERRRSAFGDRRRTGNRGPHELWIVEGGRRALVDVWYERSRARRFPGPFFPFDDAAPSSLKLFEEADAMQAFVANATGRCRARRNPG